MIDHRQGNDLAVLWSIFKDGEPFDLRGRSLKLYLKNLHERKEVVDFSVTGNEIHWTFYGKDQDTLGKHSLILVANEDEKGMITTDACDFVRLVSCSCKLQGGEDAPNVETESIELTSTLEYVAGMSEEEVLNLLDGKVDKEEGKGLSTNDYTDEDREKLAGLENYDDGAIRKEIDKKVDYDQVATINGKSLINGGNIVIEGGSGGADSPVGYGDAEHSAVLKGETTVLGVTYKNEALNEGCVSLGANSKAGLKGYYFTYIDFNTKKIWLHNKQFTSRTLGSLGGWKKNSVSDVNRCGWAKDDIISFTCNGHYDNSAKIVDVVDNVITVDKLPFTLNDVPSTIISIEAANNKFDECSVFCVKKFNIGTVELGGNAFAIGTNTQASNAVAYAEGYNTVAYGKYSHAEGNETEAGYNAHSEGYLTKALGERSHAEGHGTTASGDRSHAEGRETTATGNQSHAEGYKTKANGGASHAEGSSTEAGENAHSEGLRTKATGDNSHAEGQDTQATGARSHAEGKLTVASGDASHSEGQETQAIGAVSHAEGVKTVTNTDAWASHVEGYNCETGGNAEVNDKEADGDGIDGQMAHAEGNSTIARGNASHAEGTKTIAVGTASHAEGIETKAKGDYSHAEGNETEASGIYSHAEGYKTAANGASSHAEGEGNSTEAVCSHIEGYSNKIYKNDADSSHAEGENNIVNDGAYASHVEGEYNQVNNRAEHASGQYNKSKKSGDKSQATQFSIGIGTSENNRKNAFEVKANGDIYIEGFEKPIQQELTELSAEVSGLSEKIENLPSGESSVFEAVYGTTTFAEIVEAYNAGKVVIMRRGNFLYYLNRIIANTAAYFFATYQAVHRSVVCSINDAWSEQTIDMAVSVVDNGDGTVSITANKKTAEVASGTPSGDPMHYMFEAAGATYNATDADIPMVGVYGDSYVHKAKHWHLNELGDLTNEEMRKIYSADIGDGMSWNRILAYYPLRTHKSFYYYGYNSDSGQFRDSSIMNGIISTKLVTFLMPPIVLNNIPSFQNPTSFLYNSKQITKILNPFKLAHNIGSAGFLNATNLQEMRLHSVAWSISFATCSKLSNASILYMIENAVAANITITLHASAYDRAMADADIQAAMTSKQVNLAKA